MENINKILVDLFKDDSEYIKENKISKEAIYAKAYSYDEGFLKKS